MQGDSIEGIYDTLTLGFGGDVSVVVESWVVCEEGVQGLGFQVHAVSTWGIRSLHAYQP